MGQNPRTMVNTVNTQRASKIAYYTRVVIIPKRYLGGWPTAMLQANYVNGLLLYKGLASLCNDVLIKGLLLCNKHPRQTSMITMWCLLQWAFSWKMRSHGPMVLLVAVTGLGGELIPGPLVRSPHQFHDWFLSLLQRAAVRSATQFCCGLLVPPLNGFWLFRFFRVLGAQVDAQICPVDPTLHMLPTNWIDARRWVPGGGEFLHRTQSSKVIFSAFSPFTGP